MLYLSCKKRRFLANQRGTKKSWGIFRRRSSFSFIQKKERCYEKIVAEERQKQKNLSSFITLEELDKEFGFDQIDLDDLDGIEFE